MAMPETAARGPGQAAIAAIERQRWLEPVADRLQRMVVGAYRAGGRAGRTLRDVLHGTWLGHPLHPVLTDVPLGAWTAALVLDGMATAGASRAADAVIGAGLAGAVGAAVTGLTDWQHTTGADRRTGLAHGLLNVTAATLYAASLLLRRRGARSAGRAVAGLGFVTAAGAAYLGGHLVYRRRLGVDHAPPAEAWPDFVRVLPEADLGEARPRRAEARGIPIVLVRRHGRIHALAETCAHLGGPLAEGTVEDTAIRCPWHGSRFALEDGRLLEGPSVYPQPCFEVRVSEGHVEVRATGR